jgi:hypothetical protein
LKAGDSCDQTISIRRSLKRTPKHGRQATIAQNILQCSTKFDAHVAGYGEHTSKLVFETFGSSIPIQSWKKSRINDGRSISLARIATDSVANGTRFSEGILGNVTCTTTNSRVFRESLVKE